MFEFRQAKEEEFEEIFRLRYQVYCLEKVYLKPEDYPDGQEKDEFDEHSVHFVAIDKDGGKEKLIGYCRLILPNNIGLPIELNSDLIEKTPDYKKTVEVSRVIAHKQFRSSTHFILLGLCKEIYLLSQIKNINYVYALVDTPVHKLLTKIGFHFYKIGHPLFYMGSELVPTILYKNNLEEKLSKNNVWLYEYFKSPKEDQNKWF